MNTEDDGVELQQASVADQVALGREFTLRLYHARGRDEVWFNSRRMLYLPTLRNPKRVGFYLQAIGISADLRVVSFSQLKPPVAPTTKPSGPLFEGPLAKNNDP